MDPFRSGTLKSTSAESPDRASCLHRNDTKPGPWRLVRGPAVQMATVLSSPLLPWREHLDWPCLLLLGHFSLSLCEHSLLINSRCGSLSLITQRIKMQIGTNSRRGVTSTTTWKAQGVISGSTWGKKRWTMMHHVE